MGNLIIHWSIIDLSSCSSCFSIHKMKKVMWVIRETVVKFQIGCMYSTLEMLIRFPLIQFYTRVSQEVCDFFTKHRFLDKQTFHFPTYSPLSFRRIVECCPDLLTFVWAMDSSLKSSFGVHYPQWFIEVNNKAITAITCEHYVQTIKSFILTTLWYWMWRMCGFDNTVPLFTRHDHQWLSCANVSSNVSFL